MKNEDRIIELLIETLQRIDRHNEEIKRHNKQFEQQNGQINQLIAQLQKHQERLDRHGEALGALRERTAAIHQTSLEQQKAYQAMTELLMFHNRALREKGLL